MIHVAGAGLDLFTGMYKKDGDVKRTSPSFYYMIGTSGTEFTAERESAGPGLLRCIPCVPAEMPQRNG